jgi:hypothetical protein
VADDAPEYLVVSVDLSRKRGRYTLCFRLAGDIESPTLVITGTELRQWLGIVRELYRQAGWSTASWPEWLNERRQHVPPPALFHEDSTGTAVPDRVRAW